MPYSKMEGIVGGTSLGGQGKIRTLSSESSWAASRVWRVLGNMFMEYLFIETV